MGEMYDRMLELEAKVDRLRGELERIARGWDDKPNGRFHYNRADLQIIASKALAAHREVKPFKEDAAGG